MVCFTILAHYNWRKNYARFESALSQHNIMIIECNERYEEIVISVLPNLSSDNNLIIEQAKKYFGTSYRGLIS
jgi:hypothetical protein